MNPTELIVARQYLHAASVGKSEASAALYPVVEAFLEAKYSEGAIDGYNLLLLPDAERCRAELVDDDWKTLVSESYPVLYVFVQPNTNGSSVFDQFFETEGLIFVK